MWHATSGASPPQTVAISVLRCHLWTAQIVAYTVAFQLCDFVHKLVFFPRVSSQQSETQPGDVTIQESYLTKREKPRHKPETSLYLSCVAVVNLCRQADRQEHSDTPSLPLELMGAS